MNGSDIHPFDATGVEVVEPHQRGRRQDLLTQAYALRHHVFVEERGWEHLRRADGLDIDSYDRGAALHVLAVDDGRIEGHVRLIPGGYLAVARADPARVSAAAGHAPLYGLSRFCICPSKQGIVARRALIVQILTVAFRSVMERGCYALLFDTDPAMIFLLRLLGFAIEYVGEPASIAGRVMQPVVLRLDMSVLSGVPLKIARWNERAGAVNARSADARA